MEKFLKYFFKASLLIMLSIYGIGIGYFWCLGQHEDKDAYISEKLKSGKEFQWDGHKIYPIKGYYKRWCYCECK